MKTIEKSMTKNDFDNFVKFNNLEVFSQNQVLAYTASLMPLIQKAQKNELSEEDKKNLGDANFEINNFKTVKVVEEVDGRIIKSLFYVREKQVEELIEKSENGESSKFVFLDTELNRKFGRVGESFEKSCGKMDITKSEEFQTYSTFKKKGISDPKGELKKVHPNVDDAKADEIEKSFEDMISGKKEEETEDKSEEKEKKPVEKKKDVELDLEGDSKEVEKSMDDMLCKITENFEKGLFTEDIYDSAAGQLENLFEKSIMDKVKLRKKMITDKNGHRSSRWVRVNKEEGKEKESKLEEDKSDSKNNIKWTELPVGTEIKFDDEPDRIYKIAKPSSVRRNEDKLKSGEIYITSPGVIGMDIDSEYLNEHAKLVKEDKPAEKKKQDEEDNSSEKKEESKIDDKKLNKLLRDQDYKGDVLKAMKKHIYEKWGDVDMDTLDNALSQSPNNIDELDKAMKEAIFTNSLDDSGRILYYNNIYNEKTINNAEKDLKEKGWNQNKIDELKQRNKYSKFNKEDRFEFIEGEINIVKLTQDEIDFIKDEYDDYSEDEYQVGSKGNGFELSGDRVTGEGNRMRTLLSLLSSKFNKEDKD